MQQVLFGGQPNDPLNNGATEYSPVSGGTTWSATENARTQCVASAGTIDSLYVELTADPGTNPDAYRFTLRKNGADTTLTCTITADATSGSDVAHSVAVVAGDVICIQCEPLETPSETPGAQWTMRFTGTTAKESLILGHVSASNASTNYTPPCTGGSARMAAEDDARQVIPTSGAIKNLYVSLAVDPGTAPDAYAFTLRKNGADTALTCTIVADDTTGNDTAHTVAVVAGDVVTMSLVPIDTPSATAVRVSFGFTFVSEIDGESIIMGGSSDDLPSADTEYIKLGGGGGSAITWNGTEYNIQTLGQVCVLRKMYVLLSAAPNTGNTYTFTPRVNAASPADGLSVAIAGTATTGNDTAHTVRLAAGDNVALMVVPDSTPDAADAYWGVVCAIAAEVSGVVAVNAAASLADAAMLIAGGKVNASASSSLGILGSLLADGKVNATAAAVLAALASTAVEIAGTEILRPDAAGDETAITAQYPDSTEHWDKVDEAVADDASTYIADTTVSGWRRDLYNLPAHSVGAGPISKITIYARIYDNGSGIAKISLKTGGSTYDGPQLTTSAYAWANRSWEQTVNPETSAAWTWDDIDALQIGIYASGNGGYIRVTQVYVEVAYTRSVTPVNGGLLAIVAAAGVQPIPGLILGGRVSVDTAAALSAVGSLMLGGKANSTATASLVALGSLIADGKVDATAAAALSILQSLIKFGVVDIQAAAEVIPTSVLLKIGAVDVQAAAGLSALCSIIAGGKVNATAAASLSLLQTLVMPGAADIQAGASMSALGSLIADGRVNATAAAVLSILQTLVKLGAVDVQAEASLSALGSIIADGDVGVSAIADLIMSGHFLIDGAVDVDAVASLVAAANLIADGNVDANAAASLTAVSSAVRTAAVLINAAAAISTIQTLVKRGATDIQAVAEVVPTSGLYEIGSVDVQAAASLSALGSIIAGGVVDVSAIADLIMSGNFMIDGAVDVGAVAAIVAAANLIADGAAGINATTSLNIAPDGLVKGVACAIATLAALTTQGNLTADGKVDIASVSDLIMSGNLLIDGAIDVGAVASLVAAAGLIKDGAVDIDASASLSIVPDGMVKAGVCAVVIAASMQTLADLICEGKTAVSAAASIEAQASLLASAQDLITAAAQVIAAGNLLADGRVSIENITALLVSLGSPIRRASAGITVVASQVAAGTMTLDGAVDAQAVAELAVAASLLADAVTAISSSAAVIPRGGLIFTLAAAISVAVSVAALGVIVRNGVVAIMARTSLQVVAIKYIVYALLGYSGSLAAGDILEIDTDRMTVKKNGTDVRYDMTGVFWKLVSGENIVEYSDTAASRTVNLDVDHEPRWS